MCLSSRRTAPPRSRSSPRCCSWPPFSEPGRGTCTYLHPGTDTCTRWRRRAGCCGETSKRSTSIAADRERILKKRDFSPFHEVDHVDDARRADHWLVGEDGPHGLFHAELRLQGRQERLDFLPEYGGGGEVDGGKKSGSVEITGNVGTYFNRLKTAKWSDAADVASD